MCVVEILAEVAWRSSYLFALPCAVCSAFAYSASVVLQAQLNIRAAYGSSKDIAVYQAIGLQTDQIFIIGKVSKKHRKEAVVCYQLQSCLASHFSVP